MFPFRHSCLLVGCKGVRGGVACVVLAGRSEERRVGKSVDLGGRRIIKKKKYNKQQQQKKKKQQRSSMKLLLSTVAVIEQL